MQRSPECTLHVPLQLSRLSNPCYYTAYSLAVLVIVYFVLFILASNIIVPGGLFM